MESQGRTQRVKKRKRASSTTSSNTSRQLPAQPELCQTLFDGLKICLTGHQAEREEIAKCVEQLGGKWCQGLKKDADILIAEHARGDKYTWAKKWGIPVVNRGWYVDSMAQGRVMGVERYRLEDPDGEAVGGKEDGKAFTHASVSQTEDAAQHELKRQRLSNSAQSAQSKEAAYNVPGSVVASQVQMPNFSELPREDGTAISTEHSLETAHGSTQRQASPRRENKPLARVGSGYTPPPSSGTVAKSKPVRPIVTATGSFAALQPDTEDDTDVDDALLDSFDHGGDPFKALDDMKPEATPATIAQHEEPLTQEQQASTQASDPTEQVEVPKPAPTIQSQATQASTSTYGMDSSLVWKEALSQIERTEKAMADTERATKAMAARGVTIVPDPPQEMFWFLSRATIPPGAKKVYAVRRGRKPYFYFDWDGADGAQAQTVGFPNALFKGFKISSPRCCEDAMFFMNHNPGDCGQPGSSLAMCNPACRPAVIEYSQIYGPAPEHLQQMDAPEQLSCGACKTSLEDRRAVLCNSCASDAQADRTFRPLIPGFNLQPEQLRILQSASRGHNLFYTGAAGTGKSTILRAMMQMFKTHRRRFEVISPTAITALNVGGRTIHSLVKWGGNVDHKPLKNVHSDAGRERVWRRLHRIQTLIVDEISMVSSNTMARLDAVMKKIFDKEKPFGGIQVIITGDFFQLPPIKPFHHCLYCGRPTKQDPIRKKLRKCLSDNNIFDDNDKWAFACPEWDELGLHCIQLTKVHRQTNHDFVTLLNKYRLGVPLTAHERTLLLRGGSMVDGNAIKIYPLRYDVSSINATKLAELKTEEFTFWCVDNHVWNGNEEQKVLY